MGITDFLVRACTQTVVYWGGPVDDGFGGKIFDDPIEIKCRWEEKEQVLMNTDGVALVSRAIIYTLQEMIPEGCLYLGTLTDLENYLDSSGGTYIDPRTVPSGICIIKRPERTPTLGSTTEFLYKAFLTPWLI